MPALPFRSPAAGGDRLGRSAKDAVAQPARPFVGVRHFGCLNEFFIHFTEMDLDGLFLLRAADAQTQNVAGFLLPRPALRAARHVRVVPTHNFVANLQATLRRWTIRVNRGDSPWASGFPLRCKTKRGANAFVRAEFEPRAGKELLVRQRIRPAYIIVEEIRERATGKFFSLKTNVEGIAIELPFPGKVRIHGAQEIVKAPLIFGAIAQDEVEQKAKHLALRVIRNAALGLVVERVFFQPRVQAGLLGALPLFGGPGFEFRDLLAQVLQEFLFAPEAGAHKRIGAERVGDAFREP